MYSPRVCCIALLAALCAAAPSSAQSVLATRAGVVHYFEGVVAVGGTPLQPQFGRFPEIPEGSELRTGQGHAEVLLGPGTMLRVAEDSAIRMVSSNLTNVTVELLTGTAILEMKDPLPGNSVSVTYKQWKIHIPKQGVYRIDSSPEQLRAYNGDIEISTGGGAPVVVKAGQTLPLGPILVPEQTVGAPGDGFNSWAFERSQAIAADNATAAQIVDDPALYPNLIDSSGLALAGYTYFPPVLGNPYMNYRGIYAPGVYNTWSPYGSPYSVGFGYGYGYGYGFAPASIYGLTGLRTGLPGRIPTLPSLPLHVGPGGGYRPPSAAFPTTRPGVMAPSMPRVAPAAGGAHPVGHAAGHR